MIVPKSYQQEGLSITYAKRLVLDFGSSNPEGSLFFFPFSKFLSLVSFFRVRLYSVRVRVSVSLARLPFRLVRLGTRAIVVTSEPFRKITKGMSQEINEVANYRNFHNRGLVSIQAMLL